MKIKTYKMRSLSNYGLKLITGCIFTLGTVTAFAQQAAEAATPAEAPKPAFVLDVNAVLAIVAVLLLLVLGVLAITLRSSMELYKRNKISAKTEKTEVAKIITMVVGLLLCSALPAVAQTGDAVGTTFSNSNILKYLLIFIIFMELVAIFAVIKWLRFFTGIEELEISKGNKGFMALSFKKFWRKANRFKPIKDEAEIDMGHSYDGIRELDNVLPPWFTWSFMGTIVFAIVYLWRFHASANPAPDQYQEYEHSVAQAQMKLDAYLASKGEVVDETNVVMLGGSDIEAGKTLYQASCVACHGTSGEGGVGPNLTDDYWLHGGRIGDIFKVIKLGVVEKGMQSWKDVFSATQIAQLSSYIKSIHGTNPPGGKAPQGDLFKEETSAAPAVGDSTVATNATDGAPADSAAAQ